MHNSNQLHITYISTICSTASILCGENNSIEIYLFLSVMNRTKATGDALLLASLIVCAQEQQATLRVGVNDQIVIVQD
jgi:hypothetical protein